MLGGCWEEPLCNQCGRNGMAIANSKLCIIDHWRKKVKEIAQQNISEGELLTVPSDSRDSVE